MGEDDFQARVSSVIQQALAGIAHWGPLRAYRGRLLAIDKILDIVQPLKWTHRLLSLGSVGDPVPYAAPGEVEGYPGRRLVYDIEPKLAQLTLGGVEPLMTLHNVMMRGVYITRRGDGYVLVNVYGSIIGELERLDRVCYFYGEDERCYEYWRLPRPVRYCVGVETMECFDAEILGVAVPRSDGALRCFVYAFQQNDRYYELPLCHAFGNKAGEGTDGGALYDIYGVHVGTGYYDKIAQYSAGGGGA